MISRIEPFAERAFYVLISCAALCAGLYGRFKGLGTWPLGVDEFYLSRSVDNILRTGLPAFACGGYYSRGLVFQYAVALFRIMGISPETAGRLIAACAGLGVLPAAFLLAKRLESSLAGWLTVIILCLSVWEIEMARFGRMYAPFQAVFTWYIIFYVRYVVSKDDSGLKWMIGLSVLGVLTWEGGALLGVANLLAVVWNHADGRLKPVQQRRFAGLLLLLAVLYLATRDLRGFAVIPMIETVDAQTPGRLEALGLSLGFLRVHPLWFLGLVPPILWSLAALRAIAARGQSLAGLGLFAILMAAGLHAFAVCLSLLMLMLLMRLISLRELADSRHRNLVLAVLGFLFFWLTFDQFGLSPATGAAGWRHLASDLFGFPDIFDVIVRPWGRTIPVLSVALTIALIYWLVDSLGVPAPDDAPNAAGALLGVMLLLALAVGATVTERIETRYTFFLYPLLMALAVGAACRFMRRRAAPRRVPILLATVPLVCFGATEDFQPWHIARIDRAQVNFRMGMSPSRAAHYYPRNDSRVMGEWLRANVGPGDIVVTGIPNLDQYYHGFQYFFLDDDDPRYEAYVCPDNRTERWTNHRFLYTASSLRPLVQSGHRVLLLLWPDTEARLRLFASGEGWSNEQLWHTERGGTGVLLLTEDSQALRAH